MMKQHASIPWAAYWTFWCLLIFVGCKKPDSSIGLGLQPESDMLNLFVTDTLTLDLVTVREDSLETNNLSTAVLGRVFMPRIGWTTAGFATQLRLSAPGIDFGHNPIVDSMFLSLRFTGDTYGQLSNQSILVEQLADSISYDSSYYSHFSPEGLHENLVDPSQGAISLNPSEDLIVGEDTIVSQIRLKLKNSIGQTILNQDTTTFESNDSWLRFFHGIVITTLGDGVGATGIDISSGMSLMRLHYHNDVDTAFYDFIISPLSARVNMFEQDYVGELSYLNSPPSDSAYVSGEKSLYVMSGAGLKARLRIPFLNSITDSLGPERAVQKAEIILPLDESFFDSRYPPHEQLFVLTETPEGNSVSTPDQVTLGVNIDGYYDYEAKEYHFNISRTIQQLLNRDSGIGYGNFSPENPVPPLYIVSSRAGISIQGVVIKGTGVEEKPARLVLTCSH
ncbi:MAG TPA: DUF4270 family protein [Flavobacteriales bacterium]|nr:DUF4270 family protein [Flavobacteriales bacterium]HHZ96916.1 DUF4270 family protein [Flavobacteriales bacterium]HIB78162.1 DUF4270 family protein [Flavobacteriales bacterium]HIN41961.1 DUF4270 family protein [Flavobacteriales bacterium]HIO16286.1 DUF4270 family protein [Flavobacteriales bacterium]